MSMHCRVYDEMDSMSTDEELLDRLKAGEPAAYEWLVEHFEGPLFRFFVFDHHDYHLAQEQSSETFAQLVRSLPAMKGNREQLRAFVFSIARHVKLRQWRRPRVPHCPLADVEEMSDPRPSPVAQADNHEQIERILTAIRDFESNVRDVLLFRFVEGYAIEEVARLVNLPVGTVKSHIHRGVARLKTLLSDSGCQT